jgi:hypothetical protein
VIHLHGSAKRNSRAFNAFAQYLAVRIAKYATFETEISQKHDEKRQHSLECELIGQRNNPRCAGFRLTIAHNGFDEFFSLSEWVWREIWQLGAARATVV